MRGDISSICWWAGGTHSQVRESKYLRHGRVVHAFPLCRRELRIEPHLHLHRSLWHLGVEPRKAEGESRDVRQSRGRRESQPPKESAECLAENLGAATHVHRGCRGIFTAASLNTCGSTRSRGEEGNRPGRSGRAERVTTETAWCVLQALGARASAFLGVAARRAEKERAVERQRAPARKTDAKGHPHGVRSRGQSA